MSRPLPINKTVELSPACAEDEEFLCALYCDSRRAEVSAWGWNEEQQNAFLKMQFMMQHRSYKLQFPEAERNLILLNGNAVGQLTINRTAEEMQLNDIAVLSEYQNLGIGKFLIKQLQTEAAGCAKPLVLQVQKTNEKARRLYENLDFLITGESDFTFQMKWQA